MFTEIRINRRYRSNENNIPKDFYIPLLEHARLYKRAVGYFSTSALVQLSVGLAAMAEHGGNIQIVCSPKLNREDIDAIHLGYKVREKAFVDALEVSLRKPLDKFEEERLNMVATLVAEGTLTFKLAFMETNTGINIFHEKIAVAYDEGGNRICFSGSMNDSENGLTDNLESFVVFCDWKSEDQKAYIEETEQDFDKLWRDDTQKVRVLDFPKVILDKLLSYQKGQVNYQIDKEQYCSELSDILKPSFIQMPEKVTLLDYQRQAIQKWCESGYRGIYDMATGTGKTYTALGSIEYLAKSLDNNIAVIIVCPYVHLVGQWQEDLLAWNTHPIIAHSQAEDRQWEKKLTDSFKRFRRLKKPFVCVTTKDTYISRKIQQVVEYITDEMNVLLVVDEAHNAGAAKMSNFLESRIKYRLALSATIERFGDPSGTKHIYDYFGKKCIEYSLEKAIDEGKSLCPYEYHVIYAHLAPDELEQYNQITKELRHYLIYEDGKRKLSKAAQIKLFQRKRILAGAREKISLLEEAMEPYKKEKYILVYCGACNVFNEETQVYEKQIHQVTEMIERKLHMDVHPFTAQESVSERMEIKECFARGRYQVLTAMKCLDEGVNIPNIQTAFILSSSQNPKEFVQRRGRLLRKAQGKQKAVIYDFVILPRPFGAIHCGDFEKDKNILIGEMARIQEFAQAAINQSEGFMVIDEIQQAYGVSIDLEQEIECRKEGEFYG